MTCTMRRSATERRRKINPLPSRASRTRVIAPSSLRGHSQQGSLIDRNAQAERQDIARPLDRARRGEIVRAYDILDARADPHAARGRDALVDFEHALVWKDPVGSTGQSARRLEKRTLAIAEPESAVRAGPDGRADAHPVMLHDGQSPE